jgi:hypothetical protein
MSGRRTIISYRFNAYILPVIPGFILVFVCIGLISTPPFNNNQLVGVVLGSLISIYVSILLYWQQRLDKLKPISRGFLIEINCFKPFIEEWLANYQGVDLKQKTLFTIFDFNRPFYTEESLFHIFRKEVYEFDLDLSQKIFGFFSLIRSSEESRRFLINNIQEHFHPVMQEESMRHIEKNLTKALKMIPELEKMLIELDKR